MQPPTDGPRAGYTTAEVLYLIQNTSSFDTGMGLELLGGLDDMNPYADLSDDLAAASVSRNNFADIHGSATFGLAVPLSWGNDVVRPYMTMTGPTSATATSLTTMRFYLGAYFADSPEDDFSEVPVHYDATGYDVLSVLDDYIGDDYSIATGTLYLDRVEQILQSRGVTHYHIDQDQAAVAATSPKVYSLDENATWLRVVNDCLAAVGYQGMWTDWTGEFQARSYTSPRDRAPEWEFTDRRTNTMLTQRRKRSRDLYDAPNRWVFYQSNQTETAPVDGAGRYEYVNAATGDTSVEARRGRVIAKQPEGVDVADHGSLVQYAQRVIDADMQRPGRITMETAPLPLAWHMDRYVVDDAQLGTATQVLGMTWAMNLDGSDVQHEWSVLD